MVTARYRDIIDEVNLKKKKKDYFVISQGSV